MEHACVNPYCKCEDCDCEPPCTCGLVIVGHSTEEVWDAGAGELRYTVTSRYRHQPQRRRGRSEYDHDDAAGHDHGDGGGGDHGGEITIADPEELLAESLGDDSRQARCVPAFARRHRRPGGHEHTSVRTAVHNGHTIEILTSYDVRIDGEPLEAHMGVSDDGNVHYHGLPNYFEASAIDLMRRVIDAFPEDYPPRGGPENGEE